MKNKPLLLTFFLVLITSNVLFPQSKVEIKMMFYDAESWILFEDYKEALPIYQQLLKFSPNNANYKYRIGQCYINTPGEKDKSITFLEEAVKNINPSYKEGRFKETGAPYDSYYYLANAYRINNQLDKALETYNEFLKNIDLRIYDTAVVNLQIQSCLNAKELMGIPQFVKETNIGNDINENDSEFNPVVSDNEDLMVYSRSEAFYDAILMSSKVNGIWSSPTNMNELLRIDRDIYPTSLSKDGRTLYLYSSVDYDGIIYTSTLDQGTWGPLVRLNENINTKYWESHAAISHDDKKLYFTSNRKGGYEGLDIYVSERDSTGDWGKAKNLGPVINTPYNEDTPFLSEDDRTLYFSSRGHFNIGGYDIFYSTLLDNGDWSVPLNVGYPLNSTDDDVFFKPIKEGYQGYIAKYDPDGFGRQDIYRIEIFSDKHPRKFLVRGMVRIADLVGSNFDPVKISAISKMNPDQIIIVYSNPETGEFELEVPHGNYDLEFDARGGEKMSQNLNLPINNPSDSFLLQEITIPRTDFIADMFVESNQNVSVTEGDTIIFPVKTEPGSTLIIEHFQGDSLIFTEQVMVKDSLYSFKMVPLPGNNRVSFISSDRFNNKTSTDIFITREKAIISQPVARPEYTRIIAERQVAAFLDMQKNRADDNLKRIIARTETENKEFAEIDDLVSYLKEEALKDNISTEDVDLLALKVAVMDNVLTQAAVDLIARNSDGELKKLLSGTDIYRENLKTWTDLQNFILERSEGRITPEDLNIAANRILTKPDPDIAGYRDKLSYIFESIEGGEFLSQAVTATENKKISDRGEWLQSVYNESITKGLTVGEMARIFSLLTTTPGTDIKEFYENLLAASEEPFLSWLKTVDLSEEGIKTPEELLAFILRKTENDKLLKDSFFRSMAGLITAENIPAAEILKQVSAGEEKNFWYLWLISGALLMFIIIYKRRKKDKKNKLNKEEPRIT